MHDLGATYHSGEMDDLDLAPDIVIECTGAAPVVLAALTSTGSGGITCLTGVSTPGGRTNVDLAGMNRALVLENDVVLGSVNANRSHYEQAFERDADDVKVVLQVGGVGPSRPTDGAQRPSSG